MIALSRGELMTSNFENLLSNFELIKKRGWICSSTRSTGAIGITFERELGLLENNSFYPDYKDIEIKCSSKKAMYPLTLFSISFDGPGPRELQRIVELYGYPDNTFKNQNVLNINLSIKKTYLIKNKYYFNLEINENEEKIYLVVRDKKHNVIDRISYIYFATIKNRLITKMHNLAFVYGDCKYENNNFYFKYTDILLYTLKDFDTFLNLLKNDDILTSIGYRINKSAKHFGKTSSKNIVFAIHHNKISKLFNKEN